jgi:hypothetical protein
LNRCPYNSRYLPWGPDEQEVFVLHDQGKVPGYRRTAMAMKYQKGTVYPRGRKVKMWYGKYTSVLPE